MTDLSTVELVAQVKALDEKATKGPWHCDTRIGCVAVHDGKHRTCLSGADKWAIHYHAGRWVGPADTGHWEVLPQHLADAEFIAAARTLLPELTRRLEKYVQHEAAVDVVRRVEVTELTRRLEDAEARAGRVPISFELDHECPHCKKTTFIVMPAAFKAEAT